MYLKVESTDLLCRSLGSGVLSPVEKLALPRVEVLGRTSLLFARFTIYTPFGAFELGVHCYVLLGNVTLPRYA